MHILSPVTDNCFLNQLRGENDYSYDFMINLHKSYVAKLGFELVTPGSAVIWAINCARNPATRAMSGIFTYSDCTSKVNYCSHGKCCDISTIYHTCSKT